MVETESGPGYMGMYPYGLNVPSGWKYPAACTTGTEKGVWAASVDQQRGTYLKVMLLI